MAPAVRTTFVQAVASNRSLGLTKCKRSLEGLSKYLDATPAWTPTHWADTSRWVLCIAIGLMVIVLSEAATKHYPAHSHWLTRARASLTGRAHYLDNIAATLAFSAL